MSVEISQSDRRLLDRLQRSVPLVRRPFQQLAGEVGATERQVIARVAELAAPEGIIREISGIFDAGALGWSSTLVAMRCRQNDLDRAGAIVSGHPGVSHGYARDGELNLWFTLTVPPGSSLGLEGTLQALGRLIRPQRMLSLPCRVRYKLQVRFDPPAEEDAGEESADGPGPPEAPRQGGARPLGARPQGARPAPPEGPRDSQVRAIRALQEPLAALAEPFDPLARPAGMSADDLLVHAADFLAAGWMRRYAAVLRHRQAGALANVLVAWHVPPERTDAFARQAAASRQVSHCYLRAPAEGWPFNLYTMIHGATREQVQTVIEQLAAAGGDFPRAVLPTVREYRKARVRLFSEAFARWEAQAL